MNTEKSPSVSERRKFLKLAGVGAFGETGQWRSGSLRKTDCRAAL